MLNLVLFILVVCFLVCTISGVIGFFTDLRNFKAEHEFSGNRKQLIEFLMFGEDVEIKAVPAVETNDSEVNDNESTHSDLSQEVMNRYDALLLGMAFIFAVVMLCIFCKFFYNVMIRMTRCASAV